MEERDSEAITTLFPQLDGDESQVAELDSLCMYCHEQGKTRLMLTLIPHFREVVISSFSCDHCGHEERGIQSGGSIQEKGVKYTVNIQNETDMNRQVVKSEWASLSIPEIDFEQPNVKRGEVNTVEGLLTVISESLAALQPARREQDPDTASKIDDFIVKLTRLKLLDDPFTMVLDDPSGNSYVENPTVVPEKDAAMVVTHYIRSRQQDVTLGLTEQDEEPEEQQLSSEAENDPSDDTDFTQEVLGFQTNCPDCNRPCETNMKVVDIPFFKQCILMAITCDVCGYRENEVKSGSGIEDKGKRTTLKLTDISDMSRDILKSDTCSVKIPELEFELVEGTLGGRFTTVEGLLVSIKQQLSEKNPFIMGDSAEQSTTQRLREFCDKITEIIEGRLLQVHLVLDDPAGNSYIQNVYAPDVDPEMWTEQYERTPEQNESLGLNDMNTENYTTQVST